MGYRLSYGLLAVVVISIIWEIYEKFIGTQESILNSSFDIFVCITAFLLAFYLIQQLENHNFIPYILIIISIFAYIIIFLMKKISL